MEPYSNMNEKQIRFRQKALEVRHCAELYRAIPAGERPSAWRRHLSRLERLITDMLGCVNLIQYQLEQNNSTSIHLLKAKVGMMTTKLNRINNFIEEKTTEGHCSFKTSVYNRRCRANKTEPNEIRRLEASLSQVQAQVDQQTFILEQLHHSFDLVVDQMQSEYSDTHHDYCHKILTRLKNS